MEDMVSVRQWQETLAEGACGDAGAQTRCGDSWCARFRREEDAARKAQKLGEIVCRLKDGGRIDLDTSCVWLENSCPICGQPCDDFRFVDIETGYVIYTVVANEGGEGFKYVVWGQENEFEDPIAGFSNTQELVNWLNVAR